MITFDLLEASDLDCDPSFIKFSITKQPLAGRLMMKSSWDEEGFSHQVEQFKQADIDQVFYIFCFLFAILQTTKIHIKFF